MKLKFGGHVLHGVQTDSSNFGEILFKNSSQERVFLIFNWLYTEKSASVPPIRKSIIGFLMMSLLNDVTIQLSL